MSCLQKFLSATIVEEWVRSIEPNIAAAPPFHERGPFAGRLAKSLLAMVTSPALATYTESDLIFDRLFSECLGLYQVFLQQGQVPPAKIPALDNREGFTLARAQQVVKGDFEALLTHIGRGLKKSVLPILDERRRQVIEDIGHLQKSKEQQDITLMAAVGAAVVVLGAIPVKLNPLIRSIMNSIKVRCLPILLSFRLTVYRTDAFLDGGESRASDTFGACDSDLHRSLLFSSV
jgi:TATA-binding protein-associated factor